MKIISVWKTIFTPIFMWPFAWTCTSQLIVDEENGDKRKGCSRSYKYFNGFVWQKEQKLINIEQQTTSSYQFFNSKPNAELISSVILSQKRESAKTIPIRLRDYIHITINKSVVILVYHIQLKHAYMAFWILSNQVVCFCADWNS